MFLCRGIKYSRICRSEGKKALLLLGQEELFVTEISWMGNLRDTAKLLGKMPAGKLFIFLCFGDSWIGAVPWHSVVPGHPHASALSVKGLQDHSPRKSKLGV